MMDTKKDATELKCKYCGGRLRPDTPRRDIQADKRFEFYRCETCNMPDVAEVKNGRADR